MARWPVFSHLDHAFHMSKTWALPNAKTVPIDALEEDLYKCEPVPFKVLVRSCHVDSLATAEAFEIVQGERCAQSLIAGP